MSRVVADDGWEAIELVPTSEECGEDPFTASRMKCEADGRVVGGILISCQRRILASVTSVTRRVQGCL